jgi:hypothetical protein
LPTDFFAIVVAFFFCVFELRYGAWGVLPSYGVLLPEPDEEARCRVAVALAEANWVALRNGCWLASKFLLAFEEPPLF